MNAQDDAQPAPEAMPHEALPYAFDPDLAPLVPLLPEVDITDPVAFRAAMAEFAAAGGFDVDRTGLTISDHLVAQSEGPDVRVRVYRPQRLDGQRAALLYIHGGGFVIGSIETEEMNAIALARDLGVVIASVDYRLAPEHPYPAALDDCLTALSWLHAQASELGIGSTDIGVYGTSAGGGLAAGLALRARDLGGPAISFQFLAIPELDDRLDSTSMSVFLDTPLWSRPNAVLSWRYYLRGLVGEVPPYAAPSRATDLQGLPPAYVCVMEFDPLRDEAIDYAARLLQAGVQTELHVFPGTFHGSSLIPGVRIAERGYEEGLLALRRGLRLHA